MSNQIYTVAGNVQDIQTKTGIAQLRVEVWDEEAERKTALAESFTDEEGDFIIPVNLKKLKLEKPPNVYFKIYQGNKMLEDTKDKVGLKKGSEEKVTIGLKMPSVRKEGKDRITAEQIFKAADFFQQSDFAGVFSETKKKLGTSGGFIADMVMNTVKKMDIKPIKPGMTKEHDVVNRDVREARESLSANNISVNEVKAYNPALDKASFRDLSLIPPKLQPGQKVDLYEENGKVKYYAVVKTPVISDGNVSKVVEAHQAQLEKMQNELAVTKKNSAQKDEHILKLQEELKALRRDHNKVNTLIKSDAFVKLMKDAQKKNPKTPPK